MRPSSRDLANSAFLDTPTFILRELVEMDREHEFSLGEEYLIVWILCTFNPESDK